MTNSEIANSLVFRNEFKMLEELVIKEILELNKRISDLEIENKNLKEYIECHRDWK